MKKILLFLVICLVVSGFVFAQNTAVKTQAREQETNTETVRAGEDTPKPVLISAEPKVTAEQLRERTKLRELSQEKLQTLARLKVQNREKIEALTQEQIQRLTVVKAERLAKISRNLNQKNLEKIASLDQRQLENLATLDRTRLREYVALSDEALKAKLDNIKIKKVAAEKAFKERVIAKERIQLAKQNLNKTKERYEKAKEQIKTHRQLLLGAVTDEDKITHLKDYLTYAIDTVIERLNKLKEKINENENIDEATANEKIIEIDNRISELEELKTKIDAATTLEELKELGKDTAGKWKAIKANNRIRETILLRANVQEVFKRSEHLEARLEKALSDMEEQGIDVEGIDAKINSFSAKINEARELFKQSQERFNEAKQNKVEATVQEAQSLAKQANERLREAHASLVEIIKDIRNAGGNADEIEEPETGEIELVEEVDENE